MRASIRENKMGLGAQGIARPFLVFASARAVDPRTCEGLSGLQQFKVETLSRLAMALSNPAHD